MNKTFGFKVLINNKIICRAGFKKENSVVSCILDTVKRKNVNSEELNISIGGLNTDSKEYVDWFKDALHEGDKISIEIITDNFDTPTSIRKSKQKKDSIKSKIEHFYKLKEELKNHLPQ